MSLVGPRPEVEQYVHLFRAEYAHLLSVRPGITDLASMAFPDEERSSPRLSILLKSMVAEFCHRSSSLSLESVARSSLGSISA